MLFQESEGVELKEVVTDDIKREIIAFANCAGGKIYVGVRDDGSVIGLDDPDGAALRISNMVRDAIKPDLTMFLHYETLNEEGKYIIAVDIQRGTDRPYYIAKKGLRPEGVYIRQGCSSVSAADAAIRRMIKETDGDSFEKMRSQEQRLSFESAKKEFSERNIAFGAVQMKTLGIVNQDGIYTNLGLLLSEQCAHTIKCALFEGSDESVFKDRKEFSGSLFKQMHEVYDYIDSNNRTGATFDKLRRIDVRDYPEAAVREAFMNLLVHREYSFSASAFINIFADRIEFTSIGGLISGITLKDVLMGISVCRNANLANVFYRLGLIEAYGTGMSKILGAYEGSGTEARVEVSDNVFKVTLPNLGAQREKKAVCRNAESREAKVLRLANEQGAVTRGEVESLLGIAQTTSVRLLNTMIRNGQLVREGVGKGIRYRPMR